MLSLEPDDMRFSLWLYYLLCDHKQVSSTRRLSSLISKMVALILSPQVGPLKCRRLSLDITWLFQTGSFKMKIGEDSWRWLAGDLPWWQFFQVQWYFLKHRKGISQCASLNTHCMPDGRLTMGCSQPPQGYQNGIKWWPALWFGYGLSPLKLKLKFNRPLWEIKKWARWVGD